MTTYIKLNISIGKGIPYYFHKAQNLSVSTKN